MTVFSIKLADVSLCVHAMFPETKHFCRDYLTEEKPAFEIVLSPEDITGERKRSERQMEFQGLLQLSVSDEYLETLALFRKVTEKLLDYGVLLLHCAVLACEGNAYAFTAESGTGKTTHCKLWLENIPDCHILNGDKPLLLIKDNNVYACGTPWMGKECFGTNEILPLRGISILERSAINHIERVSFAEAYSLLLNQIHRPEEPGSLSKVIRLMSHINNIDLFRLGCNMQTEAAKVAYNAMIRGAI